MIVQHNIMALNSYNRLANNNTLVSKNIEKLSSGFKINRAGDDAAGLAISEKMRAQVTGLTRATQNAQDGISLVQTAEGQLTEVHSMLNRMVDLATQSSNGTYDGAVDRVNLQKEVQSLKDEIDRIATNADFNGIKLLDGSLGEIANTFTAGATGATGVTITGGNATNAAFDATFALKNVGGTQAGFALGVKGGSGADANTAPAGVTFKIASTTGTDAKGSVTFEAVIDEKLATVASKEMFGGMRITVTHGQAAAATDTTAVVAKGTQGGGLNLQIGDTAAQRVKVTIGNQGVAKLGLTDVDVSTEKGAENSIALIKTAINSVSGTRADLGAIQNRLEHTVSNLTTTTENMTAAESRIRDTDMAKEMMNFTKNNVLSQAAQAMLAQANQQPQQVLQLLR